VLPAVDCDGREVPGNVRELRNVLERAVLVCAGGEITPEHLPAEFMRVNPAPPPARPTEPAGEATPAEESERARIVRLLARHAGNQTRVAKELGISRTTLSQRLGEYDLPRPRSR
jgi:DNA-binding NtrC family response regulator